MSPVSGVRCIAVYGLLAVSWVLAGLGCHSTTESAEEVKRRKLPSVLTWIAAFIGQ